MVRNSLNCPRGDFYVNVEANWNESNKKFKGRRRRKTHFALQPPGGNQVDGLPPAPSSCRAKMLSCFASKQYSCSGKWAEKGSSFFWVFLTEKYQIWLSKRKFKVNGLQISLFKFINSEFWERIVKDDKRTAVRMHRRVLARWQNLGSKFEICENDQKMI